MANNKINIAELLRNCPHGMELDSPAYNNLYFDTIIDSDLYPIKCYTTNNGMINSVFFTKYGEISREKNTKCVIFPKSTTWEEMESPCKFKDGDIVFTHANCLKVGVGNTWISIFKEIRNGGVATYVDCCENEVDYYDDLDGDKPLLCMESDILRQRFATEEEKVKLFNKIKEHGCKWNPETKTLETLIKPKFKIGDRIKTNEYEYIIVEIKDGYYLTECGNKILIKNQDYFKLVPDKFDISTLTPFETKFLVRDRNTDIWKPAIFGVYIDDYREQYKYVVVGGTFYEYLIPYKGNEHLRGKTDDCDEYYKTWK